MKIEIVGAGCPKCKATENVVQQVVEDLELQVQIQKVEDMDQIIARGVMMTPAVIIDGTVQIIGHVPSPEELKNCLIHKSKKVDR